MWRRSTIASAETLSDTEVWEYQLPTSGVLNGFLLHIENTNGGTDNMFNPIYKNVNWIEVVDGSRTLLRVTGVQAELLSLIASGGVPRSKIREPASDVQTFQALLLFGMQLWDNELGLDLSKLVNPKIRVDVDFTSVRAVGVSGFLAGSGNISAVLFVNDGEDVPTVARFVKSHEIKRWTTSSSGDETTQAPVDSPWARLLVRAHVAGSRPDQVLTDVKVSFDAGQKVPLQEKTKWQGQAFPLMFGGHPRMEFTLDRTDAETVDLEHASIEGFSVQSTSVVDRPTLTAYEHGNVVTSVVVGSTGAASSADNTLALSVWPAHPYMAMVWDFVAMGMFDATRYQRGDIVLTQAVASAAASIVLQQLNENVVVA